MIYIGVDPDTEHTGVVALEATAPGMWRWHLSYARARGGLALMRMPTMASALAYTFDDILRRWTYPTTVHVAIEWQHIRVRGGENKNPNSIMPVQAVAGMAVAAVESARRTHHDIEYVFPAPNDWKGSVPKPESQRRILVDAERTASLDALQTVPKTIRSEVIDAMGLCLWLKRGKAMR